MASMNAWPSVSIKRAGNTIISQKVVKCEWSDTLGEIVERVDRNLSHEVVEKVIVSSNGFEKKRAIRIIDFLFLVR